MADPTSRAPPGPPGAGPADPDPADAAAGGGDPAPRAPASPSLRAAADGGPMPESPVLSPQRAPHVGRWLSSLVDGYDDSDTGPQWNHIQGTECRPGWMQAELAVAARGLNYSFGARKPSRGVFAGTPVLPTHARVLWYHSRQFEASDPLSVPPEQLQWELLGQTEPTPGSTVRWALAPLVEFPGVGDRAFRFQVVLSGDDTDDVEYASAVTTARDLMAVLGTPEGLELPLLGAGDAALHHGTLRVRGLDDQPPLPAGAAIHMHGLMARSYLVRDARRLVLVREQALEPRLAFEIPRHYLALRAVELRGEPEPVAAFGQQSKRDDESSDADLRGWFRKSDASGRRWQLSSVKRRYFVLRGPRLLYFRDRVVRIDASAPAGEIDLRAVLAMRSTADASAPPSAVDLEVRLPTGRIRTYTFDLDDGSGQWTPQRQEWITELAARVPAAAVSESLAVNEASQLAETYEALAAKLRRLELDLVTGVPYSPTDARTFKPSSRKKDADLRCVPTNLHLQRLLMGGRHEFDVVTMGVPAAQVLGFANGGLRHLQERLYFDLATVGDSSASMAMEVALASRASFPPTVKTRQSPAAASGSFRSPTRGGSGGGGGERRTSRSLSGVRMPSFARRRQGSASSEPRSSSVSSWLPGRLSLTRNSSGDGRYSDSAVALPADKLAELQREVGGSENLEQLGVAALRVQSDTTDTTESTDDEEEVDVVSVGNVDDLEGLAEEPEAEEQSQSHTGMTAGWMHKRGHVVKRWQRRWFVLDEEECVLRYFGAKGDTAPKGQLHVGSVELWDGREFGLLVVDRDTEVEYFLQAASAAEQALWLDALRRNRASVSEVAVSVRVIMERLMDQLPASDVRLGDSTDVGGAAVGGGDVLPAVISGAAVQAWAMEVGLASCPAHCADLVHRLLAEKALVVVHPRGQVRFSTDAYLRYAVHDAAVREAAMLRAAIELRLDQALPQLLAAVALAFRYALLTRPAGEMAHVADAGFLVAVESLLSTHGRELGMLEDCDGCIRYLAACQLQVAARDASSAMDEFALQRAQSGSLIVRVLLGAEELERLPPARAALAGGGLVPITPVLFTHGINEWQRVAEMGNSSALQVQRAINAESLDELETYVSYLDGDVTPGATSAVTALRDALHAATRGVDSADVILAAARAVRELGGARITCCKSGKDRTGMSVTLEQSIVLHRWINAPIADEARVLEFANVMRGKGVRLAIARKNIGVEQFAFNALQRKLLPELYTPPAASTGGAQS